MKITRSVLLLALFALPLRAELPTYVGWPKCLPILGFTADEIGVAAFETFTKPERAQRWVCMVIDRSTLIVTPIDEVDFDERFPGVKLAGNHATNDCQEMSKPNADPAVPAAGAPSTCIETRVLCGDRVVPVKVSAAVLGARCPGRVFSSATMIDGRLWAGINPLDPYYRELDGSDLLVQSLADGGVVARRSSAEIEGRSVCAIRADSSTGHVWATTETGLAELRPDGSLIRTLRFVATKRPMANRVRR